MPAETNNNDQKTTPLVVQQTTDTKTLMVYNQTPYRIGVEPIEGGSSDPGDLFSLPAFGSKEITIDTRKAYDFDSWQAHDLIEFEQDEYQSENVEGGWLVALGFATLVIILWLTIGMIYSLLTGSFPRNTFLSIAVLLFVITVIILKFFGMHLAGRQLRSALQRIGVWFQKSPYILIVLIIGWGIPALTIYYLGEGHTYVGEFAASNFEGLDILVLGRLLQFFFLGIATTLPAMLYLLFGRQKLESVHDSFVKHILMLDPTVRSRKEASEKYRSLLEEVYGISNLGNLNQLRGATIPLIISTLLIAMGWTLTLLPIGSATAATTEETIISLFSPVADPLVFGFLGAYFFTLNMVFRRYVRGDLNPKTYIHISVRMLTTIILVWALSAIFKPTGLFLLSFAFMIGIIPDTGTTLLQEHFRKMTVGITKKLSHSTEYSLEEQHPLTVLEGINIYDRARFQEEGINNVENLVCYDLIELIARTRVPIYRLIDMYDQAILHIHLGIDQDQIEMAIKKLRTYGIRTATDLLDAQNENPAIVNLLPPNSSGETTQTVGEPQEPLSSNNGQPKESLPSELEVVCKVMAKHSWISNLQYWRMFQTRKDEIMNLEDLGYVRHAESTMPMDLLTDNTPVSSTHEAETEMIQTVSS